MLKAAATCTHTHTSHTHVTHTHVTKERRRGSSLSVEGSIVMSRVARGRNATHFAGSGIERGVCR